MTEFDGFSVDFDPSVMQAYLGAFLAVGTAVFLFSRLTGPSISSSPDPKPEPPRNPGSGTPGRARPAPAAAVEVAAERGQPASPSSRRGEGQSAPPLVASAERRRSLRRKGKPVKALLSDPATGEPPVAVWVVDRSRGGVALVVPRPLSRGATLNILPCDAPEGLEPVRLEVRSCRRKGHRWLAGCKFTAELPWGVLLLFG